MTAPPPDPYGPPPGWPGQPPYQPPGYGYPPPGYPPPGYRGYPGFTPYQPGIIPLHRLSLSDIFNGAVGYIRANPTATLGMTTVVVLITSAMGVVIGLVSRTGPGDAATVAGLLTSTTVTLLATILLSGMLTVVVARAVLGRSITVAEAWRQVRGRMPALVALSLLEIVAALMMIGAVILAIAGVARAADGALAALVGIPLVLLLMAALAVLFTVLSLAPVAIVLERKSVADGIARSVGLARRQFWRILGIRVLAAIVAVVVAGVISIPFEIVGQVVSFGGGGPHTPTPMQWAVVTIGQAIGQIITTPFTAGVVALLYVDARIRSEAFDVVLRSVPAGVADVDGIWLTR